MKFEIERTPTGTVLLTPGTKKLQFPSVSQITRMISSSNTQEELLLSYLRILERSSAPLFAFGSSQTHNAIGATREPIIIYDDSEWHLEQPAASPTVINLIQGFKQFRESPGLLSDMLDQYAKTIPGHVPACIERWKPDLVRHLQQYWKLEDQLSQLRGEGKPTGRG